MTNDSRTEKVKDSVLLDWIERKQKAFEDEHGIEIAWRVNEASGSIATANSRDPLSHRSLRAAIHADMMRVTCCELDATPPNRLLCRTHNVSWRCNEVPPETCRLTRWVAPRASRRSSGQGKP